MLYAILCYNSEDVVGAWSKAEDDRVMARLAAVEAKLTQEGRLGPVARLLPTTSATTLRKSGGAVATSHGGSEPLVIDGPFAETKEQLLGFFIVDCVDLDAAIATARELADANPGTGAYELRPLAVFHPGSPAS